jgi:hypothetical protein
MAKSARIADLNRGTARTKEQPSTAISRTIDNFIPSPRPSKPEEARIAVDKAAGRPHRDFRIEKSLTDEHGDDVKLKKGAHVEIAVTATP